MINTKTNTMKVINEKGKTVNVTETIYKSLKKMYDMGADICAGLNINGKQESIDLRKTFTPS